MLKASALCNAGTHGLSILSRDDLFSRTGGEIWPTFFKWRWKREVKNRLFFNHGIVNKIHAIMNVLSIADIPNRISIRKFCPKSSKTTHTTPRIKITNLKILGR